MEDDVFRKPDFRPEMDRLLGLKSQLERSIGEKARRKDASTDILQKALDEVMVEMMTIVWNTASPAAKKVVAKHLRPIIGK